MIIILFNYVFVVGVPITLRWNKYNVLSDS